MFLDRLAAKFKAAWHEADDEGRSGNRTKFGLCAIAPDMLLAYSEWLDGQGVIVPDDDPDGDCRSHDELVNDFINKTL